jgi:DNA-binding SARP family transcriptional activator/Tfp pilus assembly protein PilF
MAREAPSGAQEQRDEPARFRILGPLEVRSAADSWTAIGASRLRAVLAALLLKHGQTVPTSTLAELLWADRPPGSPANVISVYVGRLRRMIGDADGRVLATRPPGYLAVVAEGDLDALAFEELTRAGRQELEAGNAEGAAALLGRALGLWRGRALSDVPDSELVSAEAARLEESRLAALELRIEADVRRGLAAALIPELRRLLADEPLREGLWSLLIRSLDASGRYAEAVAAYGQAREAIGDAIGVDPGPELQALYQRLLARDRERPRQPEQLPRRAAGLAGQAGPAAGTGGADIRGQVGRPVPGQRARAEITVPAGDDRGAGLPRAGGAGPRAAPAAGSARPAERIRGAPTRQPPAQLPADVADFTGRGEQLAQLQRLLAPDRGRQGVAVAVVAGGPGLGKSALAIHAAHALRREFPDGQLFINLVGASRQPVPPEDALARFLRDLGIDGARIPVSLEERAALYRTVLTDQRVLIVLDDARDATQVRPLLPGSGSCSVIVTSRHHLSDLAGSRLVDLDILGDDEARTLFTAIVGADRTEAEPDQVDAVLRACAGLPLAIRIAGARLTARRGWTVGALADRLADQRRRMDELATGDLAVRACFQVSFEALPSPAAAGQTAPARVFRLLGAWEGPSIGVPAATALVAAAQQPVVRALEVLVDAHLLESLAPDRYRLHDLLRAYAAERAQAEEPSPAVAAAVRRILGWYLRTADAAAGVLAPARDRVPLGPPEPGYEPLLFTTPEQALRWCDLERANLVAAARQAAAQGLHEIAWKLPVAAMVGFDRHGYRAEWLATHQIALASARAIGERQGEAWVMNNLGMVLSQQRTDDALRYFRQALAIHEELGDLRGQARAANNLAFTYQLLGRHQDAVGYLRSALRLQRRIGHRYGEGIALVNLGEAYVELGRVDEAVARSTEARRLLAEVGSLRDVSYADTNLGRAMLARGREAEAMTLLEQALAGHRSVGDRYGEAQDLRYLGVALARAGRLADARQAWDSAMAICESLGEQALADQVAALLREPAG